MQIDLFSIMGPAFLVSLAIPLLTTGLVIGVVVWAIRRSVPPREDPAVEELKARFARGEIDPAEFQARMDALERAD